MQEIQALESIQLTEIAPLRVTEEQAIYRLIAQVTLKPNTASPWNAGDNTRWVELVSTQQGWKIQQLTNTPLFSDSLHQEQPPGVSPSRSSA